MSLAFIDFIGHFSFLLLALSFFMRDMLFLRLFAMAGQFVGVAFYFFTPKGPIWISMSWVALFFIINFIRIITLIIERRSVSFSDHEKELFQTVFQNFSPVEFMKLMRIGEWRTAEPGTVLANQGEALDDLKMIYNGEVAIYKDEQEIDRSRDGTLIGEMSYIQGGNATATVFVERLTRYVSWPKEELHNLMMRNPTMNLAMRTVFSQDLVRKLTERPVTEEGGAS
jgi:hypothetical protein